MNNYDEMIEVIQALKEGKEVEFRAITAPGIQASWYSVLKREYAINFTAYEYRVKKIPKKLIGYVPVCKLLAADHMFFGYPQETEAGARRYAESSGKSTVIDIFEIVYVEKL